MKTILVAWMLLALTSMGHSCDVCGIFLGVQPNDRRSNVGLNWRSRSMQGTTRVPVGSPLLLKHGDHVAAHIPSKEVGMVEMVNVVELRADLKLTEKFYLLASLPLTNTYRSVNDYQVLDAYGLGDAFVMLRYQLANTRSVVERAFIHRLLVGGGLKLPSGRSDLRLGDELVSPDMQLGTGAWDGLFSLEYAVRRERLAGGLSILARFNGTNQTGHQLGHGISSTAEVFHRSSSGDLSFAPAIGGYAEWMDHDRENGRADPSTGGTTVFSHTGVRLWWKRFSFSAYYQHALLNNEGTSITPTRQRILASISCTIEKNP